MKITAGRKLGQGPEMARVGVRLPDTPQLCLLLAFKALSDIIDCTEVTDHCPTPFVSSYVDFGPYWPFPPLCKGSQISAESPTTLDPSALGS